MIFQYFRHIHFAYPWLLLLLVILPVLAFGYFRNHKRLEPAMRVSSLPTQSLSTWKNGILHLPFFLRLTSIALLILAMARPQLSNVEQFAEGEGIDIMLCLDVSGSMTAQDFTPNRLEASKKVAIEFVNKRMTDRIGVVIFSGESFTLCPLTIDHLVVISAIQNIRSGLLEDGTAIGSGLATSVDRLRNSHAKSKVVLLLTDGENNGGLIDPKTAKEIARTFGIRVYTIGVGSEGYAQQPVNTPFGVVMQNEKVSIDEKLLTEIATETGGRYFRAKDNQGLEGIYDAINRLEKSTIKMNQLVRHQERFIPFVILALFLLLLEWVLRFTLLRRFP